MKWIKISLHTTTQAVDLIGNLFDEVGLEGIQIEDHVPITDEEKKAMYIDILPELGEDDGMAMVSSYVEPSKDLDTIIQNLENGLEELNVFLPIGDGKILVEEKDDTDWIDNWKQYFKPFYVTDQILIKPTWEEFKDAKKEDLVIEIDPGTAFGTGSHETTKLCIQGIKKYLKEETQILDIGCGSGILSIIALKLGAKNAVLTDIDPIALEVTKENLEVNKINKDCISVFEGDVIQNPTLQREIGFYKYNIVVANILADVIIPLSKIVGEFLTKDGVFISSGIINTKEKEVKKALLNHNLDIIEKVQMGDWISFVCRKK